MRNKVLVITLAAVLILMAVPGCSSNQSATTTTPIPTETLAPTIVVTPAPTQEATQEPESSESASSDSSASSSSSAGTSSASGTVLKREMEGEAVTEAQERLQALGYLDKVTGYFGTDTERAVKEFQQKNNLDADGKIGPRTMEVLMSDDAVQA